MKRIKFFYAFALCFLVFSCQKLEDKTEKVIVGKWKVVDAEVNVTDAPQAMKDAFVGIAKRSRYEFGKDNSYSLTNGTENETGVWKYDETLNAILLKVGESEVYNDTLKIEAEDKDHFSFINSMGEEGSVRLKVERINDEK